MSGSTVFVSGGSGVLGRALLPALVASSYEVRALSRSETAAKTISSLGATPVRGDLLDRAALREGMTRSELVVHTAARFREGGGIKAYLRDNVVGTDSMLEAAHAAGVRCFIYIGAAGCLVGDRPVVDADESWPLQEVRYSPYFRTKSIADRAVLAATTTRVETCSVRPGMIWGSEHDPLLDTVAEATRAGKMVFIDRGQHPIVTTHVENVVAAILLALERARGGEGYYVFDDGTVTLREFLTNLLHTRGLEAPDKSIPFSVAWPVASTLEVVWKALGRPGLPPVNRELVKLNGKPFVVSDQKARRELGYAPVITRDAGIQLLEAQNRGNEGLLVAG